MSTNQSENFQDLQVHINYFIKQENFSDTKIQISGGNKDVHNYLGRIFKVKINGKKDGKNINFNLIFKCVLCDKNVIKVSKLGNIYLHEICFYEEWLPILKNLLSEYGLTIDDIPICHGTSKTPGDEVLILEDVSYRGFSPRKSTILDYSHTLLTLQHLGRFHAYGFALRYKKPELFEKMIKSVKEPVFIDPTIYSNSHNILCDVIIKAIERDGKHYVDKINQFRNNISKYLLYDCDGNNAEPYATINHGDLWTNNVLFKYNKDSEPEDLFFVDFQIHRYASPVLDILYLLFTCCTQELRTKYYDHFLKEYHESLAECLKKFGLNVEKVFPFEILMQHLKRFGNFGACLAIMTLHLFTRQEGESPKFINDLEYLKTLFRTLETNKLYASMLRGTFKDVIDKNYI